MKITIWGKVPSKASSRQLIWNKRTGRPMIISSEKTLQYEKDFAKQVLKKNKNQFSPKDRLKVTIDWWTTDYRQDIDNIVKTIFDCLQENEIIVNDNKIDAYSVARIIDKDAPRIEVDIIKA
jgi:Holliday junction resolvase RusA-like endonuclease